MLRVSFNYLTRQLHACLNLQLQEVEKICVVFSSDHALLKRYLQFLLNTHKAKHPFHDHNCGRVLGISCKMTQIVNVQLLISMRPLKLQGKYRFVITNNISLASIHVPLYYRVNPNILSLVGDALPAYGCGSPNHTSI